MTWVCWYQKGKTSLDLNKARDYGVSGMQWHQRENMRTICKQYATHFREITTPTPCHSGRMLFLTPNQQSVKALKAILLLKDHTIYLFNRITSASDFSSLRLSSTAAWSSSPSLVVVFVLASDDKSVDAFSFILHITQTHAKVVQRSFHQLMDPSVIFPG